MSFTWPLALLSLLAAPAVVIAYLVSMRRRRREAITFSSLALLRQVIPRRSRWRRHAPIALIAAGLLMLGVAFARPRYTSSVPIGRTSIILALDVSRSMCSTDVDPNRLGAAQKAAKQFVNSRPRGTRTGLVVFAGFAQLVVPPTTSRKALNDAIDNLATGRGTAIGAAMLQAIDAIAEVNPNVHPVGNVPSTSEGDPGTTTPGGSPPASVAPAPPAAGGDYVPDIVVLLTDGANTQGIAPLDAAAFAVAQRVRIYTIAFGTSQPAPLSCSAQQLGGDTGDGRFGFGFGGGGGPGGFGGPGGGFRGRSPLVADLETLQQVAQRTGAASYAAQDASQLNKVFASLPKDVTVQHARHEVSSLFLVLGAVLVLAALAASIRWSPQP